MGRYLLVPVGTQVVVLRRRTRWEIFLLFLYRYLLLISLSALVVFLLTQIGARAFAHHNKALRAAMDHEVTANQAENVNQIENLQPRKPLGATSIASAGPVQAASTYKASGLSVSVENIGSFRLASVQDSYLTVAMVKRLNWSWPLLVKAAKEVNVPPLALAFLHYQEPIPHFALTNPANGEGVFQLHDLRKKGYYFTPYSKMKRNLTEGEFLTQARLAAEFLQKKAGNRLRFDMRALDPVVVEAVYSYNGRTYGGHNSPSEDLKRELQHLGIPMDREFVRSPYIVGRMTVNERVMYLRTKGTVKLKFYGYVPLVAKLRQLYKQ